MKLIFNLIKPKCNNYIIKIYKAHIIIFKFYVSILNHRVTKWFHSRFDGVDRQSGKIYLNFLYYTFILTAKYISVSSRK